MKTRIYILLGLMAIAFNSCELNNTSNSTPQILFVSNPSINKSDSLNRYYTDVSNVYRMDTIHVGDTVTFRMIFYGFSNSLSALNIIQSDTSSTKLLFPSAISLDSIFLTTGSDYSIGKFLFKSKISSLYFPFKYVAKKATKTAELAFYLSSNSSMSSSNGSATGAVSFILKTPVNLAKPKATLVK